MSNITEYQNLVELLKKTLEFYADDSNWTSIMPINDEIISLIEQDGGAQARFALEKIENFNKTQIDDIEGYIKNIEETLEDNDDVDDLYKTLNELKRIADQNKEL